VLLIAPMDLVDRSILGPYELVASSIYTTWDRSDGSKTKESDSVGRQSHGIATED
jgi:hypothetical protein